jgi:GNAT superfamily N-acetyltransferase
VIFETLAGQDLQDFDCGTPVLNEWLWRHAKANQVSGGSKTYLATQDGQVLGYVALAVGSIRRTDAPRRIAQGQPRDIPVLIVGRLAVAIKAQKLGVGSALLSLALNQAVAVAEIVGIRAVLVRAKDDNAKAFYQHVAEFEESPLDANTLMLLMQDIRAALEL